MPNLVKIIIFLLNCVLVSNSYAAVDPLPSWNDVVTKRAIIAFVTSVTDKKSKDYVEPKDRIATFDNDGTLWIEKPMYTQEMFMMGRLQELLTSHPEWKEQAAVKTLLAHEPDNLTKEDMQTLFVLTSIKMTVPEFQAIVKKWLGEAKNARFQKHYTQLIYQPMLEVINYLALNQFTVYIVSAAGQDFVRAFADNIYHIPAEHVIGSTVKTEYSYQNANPTLVRLAEPLFISDKTGKPQAINLFIGKKPIIAFGNSDGDREMLEWTQSNPKKHLMLLVHHDDATREYAYDTQSKVGTFSKSLFIEASQKHWQIISMKKDWKVIFG